MIYVTLGGGLGNQMFQYAYARKLEKLTGDHEMKFTGYHLVNTCNSEKMLFNLNIKDDITFCEGEEQKELEEFQEKRRNKLRYYNKLSRIFKGLAPWRIKLMSKSGFYTTYSAYEKQEHYLVNTPKKYVEGAFQTYLYWDDMFDEMRRELKVKKAPSEENQRLIDEMQACESVCVHVRRGDYLAPEFAHLNVCDEKYYMESMNEMARLKPEAVFYIFTNDHKEIEWIKENYHFGDLKVRYVDLNNPDYEELRLMYSCKHFIISNSTYSWWGQFLSDNKDKIVMAPSIWNREMSADGIYMPEWKIIQVD